MKRHEEAPLNSPDLEPAFGGGTSVLDSVPPAHSRRPKSDGLKDTKQNATCSARHLCDTWGRDCWGMEDKSERQG